MKVPRPLPTAGNGHFLVSVRGGGGTGSRMHQRRHAGKEYLKFNKNLIDYFVAS